MKEALKLALAALDGGHLDRAYGYIQEALAQPEQEPVAWMYESVCGNDFATRHKPPDYVKNIRPLYTTPPQHVLMAEYWKAEYDKLKAAHGIGDKP